MERHVAFFFFLVFSRAGTVLYNDNLTSRPLTMTRQSIIQSQGKDRDRKGVVGNTEINTAAESEFRSKVVRR